MTAEATLTPTTAARPAHTRLLGVLEQGINPRWEGLAQYGGLSAYAEHLATEAEREAAAAAVERIIGGIEGVDHPCHEVCMEPLHADCQCAAWLRQEAISAARSILQDPDPRLTEQESRP